jgi:hypothetical protein
MSDERREGPWLTAMTQYEGFPLALRGRPNANGDANRETYRHLGVVCHRLAQVCENGLPEHQYNDSLEDFDLAVQEAMEGVGVGLVVLIETFGGKRNYYAYVNVEDEFRARIASLAERFPMHQLSVECRADGAWRFYERYRKDFPW